MDVGVGWGAARRHLSHSEKACLAVNETHLLLFYCPWAAVIGRTAAR